MLTPAAAPLATVPGTALGLAVAFPVVAIATLVVGISLIVDGLTDVLDRAP